jgi:hypothetical protein
MPRRKKLTVMAYPDLTPDAMYPAMITHVDVGDALSVVLKHLSAGQEGRSQAVTLRLPVRPDGCTAALFNACGLSTEIGAEVDPKAIIGMVVNVRFGILHDTKEWQPIAFEPQATEEVSRDK